MGNKAVVGQEQRSLPAALTEIEVDNYARQLAVEVNEFNTAEVELKEWLEGMKDTKKSMEASVALLNSKMHDTSEKVNSKKEYKLVACDIMRDYDLKRVEIIRIDTGEIAESRPMKQKELDDMLQLDMEDAEATAARFKDLHD